MDDLDTNNEYIWSELMRRILIAIFILAVSVAYATDIAPVTWYDAASNEVYVACYWSKQFPAWDHVDKHLIIMIPKASWTNAPVANRQLFLTRLRQCLAGEIEVNNRKIEQFLAEINITDAKAKITHNPKAELSDWGYSPPEIEEP